MKLSGIPKISIPKLPTPPMNTQALKKFAGNKKFGMPKIKTLGDYGKTVSNSYN